MAFFGPFTQAPNIIILMTDQQRAFRYFPEAWIDENLPNFRQLQNNGLTFTNTICNASRCSPSRSVLYTGQYTWQTMVYDVGGTLSPEVPTIGKLMLAAGYEMVYKGKWHLSGGAEPEHRPVSPQLANSAGAMLEKNYQLSHWNPPDAGTAGPGAFRGTYITDPEPTSIPSTGENSAYFALGGSFIKNDDRYVIGPNATEEQHSAIEFLSQYQSSGSTQPFCLAVSLVNPHDINVFPSFVEGMEYFADRPVWQAYSGFELPPSFSDSLLQKPVVQRTFVAATNQSEPFTADFTQLEYLQFYAYLQTLPDQLFAQLMGSMSQELINNTIIIRLADHGEMGMSHGGMRFKDLNAYQETINVPLVFSNPVLFPQAQTAEQMVGLVDLLPTLASIVGLTDEQKKAFDFRGMDFSPVLLDTGKPTQERMLYTYDDEIALQEVGHIRTLVKKDYKFGVYFSMDAVLQSGKPATANVIPASFQYELYDMKNDPGEITNLLPVGGKAGPAALKLQAELYKELTDKMKSTGTIPNAWPETVPVA